MHIHIYLTHALDSCILDVYTSRYTYIMHKCVYTVTLDIECCNDLKVDKINWAKAINLFPDEFIHSSVQERTSPRPVDSIWGVTIWRSTGESLHPSSTGIVTEDYRDYFRARWVTKVYYQSYPRLLFLLYTHYNSFKYNFQPRVCHFFNCLLLVVFWCEWSIVGM